MKVIVTEEQIKRIIREEAAAQEITKELSNETNPNTILNTLATAIKSGGLSPLTLPFILKNLLTQSPQGEQQRQGILQRLRNLFGNNNQQNTEDMENQGQISAANCISNKGKYFILSYEKPEDFEKPLGQKYLSGYYATPYETHKTYGYGLRTTPDRQKWLENVRSVWTKEELIDLFEKYLAKTAQIINSKLAKHNVTLGQNQYDAVVSAVYNFGDAGFFKHKSGIWNMILQNPNNPDIPKVWANMSKGAGLERRRREEAAMYAQDIKNANNLA